MMKKNLRHSFQWRTYHVLFLSFSVIWLVLAFQSGSASVYVIACMMFASFYFDVIAPFELLNHPPQDYYRNPNSVQLGVFLFRHHYILNIVINGVLTALAAVVFWLNFGGNYFLVPLLIFPVISAHTFLTRGVFGFLKMLFAGATRIIVLRMFSEESSNSHRHIYLPGVGVFGYLVLFARYHT